MLLGSPFCIELDSKSGSHSAGPPLALVREDTYVQCNDIINHQKTVHLKYSGPMPAAFDSDVDKGLELSTPLEDVLCKVGAQPSDVHSRASADMCV